jgi:hypothetical protein
MAYMNQEGKKSFQPKIKSILKKYGVSGTLSVKNHSTICLTISKGNIDFFSMIEKNLEMDVKYGYVNVNPYWHNKQFYGIARDFLTEIFLVLNHGNWNKSDVQSDYFNVGWYTEIRIGTWDKPYSFFE